MSVSLISHSEPQVQRMSNKEEPWRYYVADSFRGSSAFSGFSEKIYTHNYSKVGFIYANNTIIRTYNFNVDVRIILYKPNDKRMWMPYWGLMPLIGFNGSVLHFYKKKVSTTTFEYSVLDYPLNNCRVFVASLSRKKNKCCIYRFQKKIAVVLITRKLALPLFVCYLSQKISSSSCNWICCERNHFVTFTVSEIHRVIF